MILRVGSNGPEVVTIQRRLAELGLYSGNSDGMFGGGTESAIRRFQRGSGLPEDGRVGSDMWMKIVGTAMPTPAIFAEDLPTRCLALTASFETGSGPMECFATVVGDFDGMGISFGALQWNIGTTTLQDLLLDIERTAPDVIDDVFHEHAVTIRQMLGQPSGEQLAWARSIQHTSNRRLDEPWHGLFKTLGRQSACIDAQSRGAVKRYKTALALCDQYGLWSERAVALMFDIAVQNGSIPDKVDAQIRADVAALSMSSRDEREVQTMEIIARRRAAAARPEFQADVLERKLTIARGTGHVHGRSYDLAEDYGIRVVERAEGPVSNAAVIAN